MEKLIQILDHIKAGLNDVFETLNISNQPKSNIEKATQIRLKLLEHDRVL